MVCISVELCRTKIYHLLRIISVCELENIPVSFLNIPLIYIRNPLSHDAYKVLLNSKLVLFFSFSVLIIIFVEASVCAH